MSWGTPKQVCNIAKTHLLSADAQVLLLSTWVPHLTHCVRSQRAGEEESPKWGQILTRAGCPAAATTSIEDAGPSLEMQLGGSLGKGFGMQMEPGEWGLGCRWSLGKGFWDADGAWGRDL